MLQPWIHQGYMHVQEYCNFDVCISQEILYIVSCYCIILVQGTFKTYTLAISLILQIKDNSLCDIFALSKSKYGTGLCPIVDLFLK